MKGMELLDDACEKFQAGRYDEALEGFVQAYREGYEREWIMENIYNCYMEGNEEEFRRTYQEAAGGGMTAYKECILDFIPYRDGEYYIFDKERKKFCGIFSIRELQKAQPEGNLKNMEFSAAILDLDWNWNEEKYVLTAAKNSKIYAVCKDLRRGMSFWKIPEFTEYARNIVVFPSAGKLQEYFHEHTSVYLPKLVYGDDAQAQRELVTILNQEHAYRLTPEGRNTENVLLTIGIPTFHRGHLLLRRIRNLQKLPYDAEIEFAVSKNGTEVYQTEYDEAGKIEDARLNYYDHGKDLKPEINWHYTVEMAHGKYVLLVSDEDDIIPEALEHYLALLRDYPDVNLLRAETDLPAFNNTEREYGKQGVDAFTKSFLMQTYLSGLIVRREDFIASDLLKFEQFSDNAFYQNYPHEWWCAALNQKGDYLRETIILISVGSSVGAEEAGYKKESEENEFLPAYATYEARLQQLQGEIEFLNEFMSNDPGYLEEGMTLVMGKIAWLFLVARDRKYDLENYAKQISEYAKICTKAIEGFPLEDERKKKLLLYLRNHCIDLFKEQEAD